VGIVGVVFRPAAAIDAVLAALQSYLGADALFFDEATLAAIAVHVPRCTQPTPPEASDAAVAATFPPQPSLLVPAAVWMDGENYTPEHRDDPSDPTASPLPLPLVLWPPPVALPLHGPHALDPFPPAPPTDAAAAAPPVACRVYWFTEVATVVTSAGGSSALGGTNTSPSAAAASGASGKPSPSDPSHVRRLMQTHIQTRRLVRVPCREMAAGVHGVGV